MVQRMGSTSLVGFGLCGLGAFTTFVLGLFGVQEGWLNGVFVTFILDLFGAEAWPDWIEIFAIEAGLLLFGLGSGLGAWDERKKYRKAQAVYSSAFPEWQTAIGRWDKLYYCSRDDCVFIPGEKHSATLDGMQSFIRR